MTKPKVGELRIDGYGPFSVKEYWGSGWAEDWYVLAYFYHKKDALLFIKAKRGAKP